MAAKATRKRKVTKEKPNPRLRAFLRSARAHGVKPIKDFDKFLEETGDPNPELDNVDEFIAWIRKSRREGRYR